MDPGEGDATRTDASAGSAAESIGPYRLLQKVGEGGMGEVWLAEQDEPIRRRVAVTVEAARMETKEPKSPRVWERPSCPRATRLRFAGRQLAAANGSRPTARPSAA